MFTCQKTYADIPFAHRQHRHAGHCSRIHGHNWSFTFAFGCRELDACGFVVDFGGLKPVREWLESNLDHACVFNLDDPLLEEILSINARSGIQVYKPYVVASCSSEGLARHLFDEIDPIVRSLTEGRAFLLSVEVVEDSRNRATYQPDAR